MESKLFEVVHRTYGDVCGDDYYGKESKIVSCELVYDTEQNVKNAVEALNKKNDSYYASEPENEYDNHYMDEDYFFYIEAKHVTAAQLLKSHMIVL